MMLLVARSATSAGSAVRKFSFSLNLPDMKFYTFEAPKSTPRTPRQVFGSSVKKFLFVIALVGLLGFQYRNRVGGGVGHLQREGTSGIFCLILLG